MNFKDKTIKEVKELTEQFKKQNPEVKTAEELLERPRVLDMTELLGWRPKNIIADIVEKE